MSVENPAVPLSAIFEDSDVYDALTGGSTTAGVKVNRGRVLGYPAVWRAVNLIAGDVGRLPVQVYHRTGSAADPTRGGKVADLAHPAAKLLRKPNEYMTAIVFRRALQHCALIDGNGYAYIERGSAAEPLSLLPLPAQQTWPVRVNGELWYVSEINDPIPGKRRNKSMVRIPAANIIHIPGLGYDGLCGYSTLTVLREAFGAALAARDYGSRFFANDCKPGIALQCPAGMKDTAIVNLRESWERLHQGLTNAHRAAILRDGVTVGLLGTANARDAQLLENRSFDAREIANIFGVPAHKLGDPSKTAYNSLESENNSYLSDTLDGWLCTWEQEFEAKLLTEEEKSAGTHCIEFNRRALIRTDTAGRGEYYSKALAGGWMNPDEVREEEGRNPIPDGSGATFTRPLNTAPIPTPSQGQKLSSSVRDIWRGVAAHAVSSAVRKLTEKLEEAARAGRDELSKIIDDMTAQTSAIRAEMVASFFTIINAHRENGGTMTADGLASLLLFSIRRDITGFLDRISPTDLPSVVVRIGRRYEVESESSISPDLFT